MRADYGDWLRARGYGAGTITAQLHRCGRVESFHGDLDVHFERDRLQSVLDLLRYSAKDERRRRPNPTKLPIDGVLRSNLASYRSAVSWYGRFCDGSAATAPVDLRETTEAATQRRSSAKARLPPPVPHEHARTMAEFGFDGRAALAALINVSKYGTLSQAVAALAVFSHPETVAQTGGAALFPVIRGVPGAFVRVDGRNLMTDDNRSPTSAFRWSNRLGGRTRDVQFNHIYARSADPHAYTALPNICMTPAFLAKATDTDADVRALLAYRSFDLYGWFPAGHEAPRRPDGYAALEWAAPLPVVANLPEVLRASMLSKPRDRTVLACQRLGWLFGLAAGELTPDGTATPPA